MSDRPSRFRQALAERVLVADGAMGTMLQSFDLSLEDFDQLEGCNEILNVTRPDVVTQIHDAYLSVGVDCIETNTFGANWANLAEYDIGHRITELARAGAQLARASADGADGERFVLGSVGPGTKLPSLGHAPFALLRDAYRQQGLGLLDGGVDAILIETVQDLLQAKAAVIGTRRAMAEAGTEVPILVSVTVETTGTMLLGSEIGAALVALEALGVDAIGLNCATGPTEMSEHLRHLSRHSRVPVTCMPNAGLPQLSKAGAVYPLTPDELATAHRTFIADHGLGLVGGCCGTTTEHMAKVVEMVQTTTPAVRHPQHEAAVASLYSEVPFRQDASYLAIGERTNANGSKAFREAMLAGDWERCVEIARAQTRDGAHLLDVCVDYVGRDGVADIKEVVSRLATASTLPLVIDSTEPEVVEAGLELIGGRAVVNSVNFEDGEGPTSRFARAMPVVREHGAAVVVMCIDEEGQARTAEKKVAIASRTIDTLVADWGMKVEDVIVDALTFPITTGQDEVRRDGLETINAIRQLKQKYPDVQTTLGVSNISFGLNPAARVVLNSVFLHEAVEAGLDSAIVHAARIMPMAQIPDEQRQVALDLVHDRRGFDAAGTLTYDPLARLLELFEGVDAQAVKAGRAAELLALPLYERLARRIVDGEKKGLEEDLDEALKETPPLEIVNKHLLEGMKVVGERFGRGEMQLPFVLQSAEVMKTAVAHLEPHIEATSEGPTQAKAKILLATVKGDVHDIGKNLVDIILSNNGYDTVNIGIKQPINEIIHQAEKHQVDAIGLSGLLVKSTVVMKENLEELNTRAMAARWPVILGGAALTRAYVEVDLAELYQGDVRYARDAFEGLRLMDAVAAAKTEGVPVAEKLPALRKRRVKPVDRQEEDRPVDTTRSDVAPDHEIPTPPFWGTRVIKGVPLKDFAAYLDERATFLGQWGLKPTRGGDGPGYEELVETEGRPRLRMWLERIAAEQIMQPAVVYGYFPCYSENNDLVVLTVGEDGQPTGQEALRFTFPRQRRDRRLCLSDFVRPRQRYETDGVPDVLPLQLVTMGAHVSEVTAELFAANNYREYMELHGLSVQLTEALAEFWHARVRDELGFGGEDARTLRELLDQGYRGSRYSIGYPACPDLEDRKLTVALLEPERIGVELSEELQLHPEQSTDALVIHHPEAKYFNAT